MLKVGPGIFLLLIVKCEKRETEEGTVKENEPKFNYLRNSQPTQTAKDAEIQRFTVEKAYSGETVWPTFT